MPGILSMKTDDQGRRVEKKIAVVFRSMVSRQAGKTSDRSCRFHRPYRTYRFTD